MRQLNSLVVSCVIGFSLALTAYGEQSELVHREYLDAVKAYADALIEHGRDSYGQVMSPVFLAGCIDLDSKQFVRRKLEGQGIREGDRAYGANPHHDLNLYQTLYALTKLTGDKRYEQEADKSLKWFFENCQSPNTDYTSFIVPGYCGTGRLNWLPRHVRRSRKACGTIRSIITRAILIVTRNGRYTGRDAGATSRGTRGFILRRGGTRIGRRRIRSS
ncbi:MAG: hypothetical protein ACYS8I_05150 [Planctomycetota bacterium]